MGIGAGVVLETVLDEEERGTRRKEGQGGRSDEEEGGTRRKDVKNEKVVKKMKIEKVI